MKNIKQFKKTNFIFFYKDKQYVFPEYEIMIIKKDDIVEKYLSDTVDSNCQPLTSEKVGDFTIENRFSDALCRCAEDVCKYFNVNLSEAEKHILRKVIYDIKLCELNQFHRITNLFDYDSLLDFIEKWKEENEVKVLCKCFEYCDGYKNKSIIFWDNEHGYSLEYHEVDDEMYETIYTAMYEGGFNYGETNPINKYSEIEGFSFEHPSMGFISGKAIYKNKSCNDR